MPEYSTFKNIAPPSIVQLERVLTLWDAQDQQEAASRLGIAQTQIALALKNLNNYFGLILLEYTDYRWVASELFMQRLPSWKILVEDYYIHLGPPQTFKPEEMTTSLTISISPHIHNSIVEKITRSLREKSPLSLISIRFWSNETQNDIKAQKIDIGIHLDVVLKNTQITKMFIAKDELRAFIRKDHPAYCDLNSPIPLNALRSYPIVAINMPDHNDGLTKIEKRGIKFGFNDIDIKYRCHSVESALIKASDNSKNTILLGGLGVSIPGFEPRTILFKGKPYSKDLCLYYNERKSDEKQAWIIKTIKKTLLEYLPL
ncbi:MAG: LysR family transcriptional regulator [Pseudomonadales bacterium]|nr:LysR family transcriptional regulator [Pseudomonadales bacterium]